MHVMLKTVICGEFVFFFLSMSQIHLDDAVKVEHTPVGSVSVSWSCMLPCAWYYAFTLGT